MANRLAFLGLGAALMYLYDPQSGRNRRAVLQNRIDTAGRQIAHARDIVRREAPNWRGRHWSPAQRALAGAFGAACATYGYFRGGVKGVAMCAFGGALVARATANQKLADRLRYPGILVERSILVNAPVDQAYAYWRDLENLPQWMSPIEWSPELLNHEENREMTWRSVGDGDVHHVGRVRFEDMGNGTSRIHVQMRYSGIDPKDEMDDDLARMKTAIETGRAPRDAGAWREGAPPSQARH